MAWTQNLGQLCGVYRDSQSNCWANLRFLGQPCGVYRVGRAAQRREQQALLEDTGRRAHAAEAERLRQQVWLHSMQ